eukprot:20442-Rhodomonas_salina.1
MPRTDTPHRRVLSFQVMERVVGKPSTPVVLVLGRQNGEQFRVFLTREVVGQCVGRAVSPRERRGEKVSIGGAEWRGDLE